MPKNQSNDKNHVLVAYLHPKKTAVAVARALNIPSPPYLAVFLDRREKAFTIFDVAS